MAKVKFNQTLTSMNGAAGDYVFTRQEEQTYARRRSPGGTGQSEKQAIQRSLTSTISVTWNAMDFIQRNGWVILQQKLGYKKPFLCFSALTKIVVNNGGSISTVAPSPDDMGQPPALPQTVEVVATNVGGVFSIRITGGPYTGGKVRVFASKAVPVAGLDNFKAGSLKQICVLDGLLTSTSVGAEYAARWGSVGVGGKIAFYLQPVSANGIMGGKVFRTPIVSDTAAADADTDEEQLKAA